jgi:type II secretory pathway predicted ATPase ExeA
LAGPPKSSRYRTVSELTDIIVARICDTCDPVLMIDEADKLKSSALRSLIPIYNRTRRRLGVVLAGTENLEKEIRSGVRANKKGFDELDSRLCRSYIKLQGATKQEVFAICEANGVKDADAKENIWNMLEKTSKPVGRNRTSVNVAEDFRVIERMIYKEKLLNKLSVA